MKKKKGPTLPKIFTAFKRTSPVWEKNKKKRKKKRVFHRLVLHEGRRAGRLTVVMDLWWLTKGLKMASTCSLWRILRKVCMFCFTVCSDLRDIVRELGAGTQGVVNEVVHSKSGEHFAMKMQPLQQDEEVRKKQMLELRTLRKSRHVAVVALYDAFYSEGWGKEKKKEKKEPNLTKQCRYVYTLLEFMDRGTLQNALRVGPVPEKVLGAVAGMMMDGLAYIHKEFHVLHRDLVGNMLFCYFCFVFLDLTFFLVPEVSICFIILLIFFWACSFVFQGFKKEKWSMLISMCFCFKPANILLNSSGEVKLSDFGVIGKVDSTLGNATTFTGSSA
jgi:serine/threonine protein kinase